jgi:hypothetical protein
VCQFCVPEKKRGRKEREERAPPPAPEPLCRDLQRIQPELGGGCFVEPWGKKGVDAAMVKHIKREADKTMHCIDIMYKMKGYKYNCVATKMRTNLQRPSRETFG